MQVFVKNLINLHIKKYYSIFVKKINMIYIQGENKLPILTDGFSALAGCVEQCLPYKLTTDAKSIPADITCLVAYVDFTNEYLKWHNYNVPEAIDLLLFEGYLGRKIHVEHSDDFQNRIKQYPVFVKPFSDIKAFTGTQLLGVFDEQLVLKDFKGELIVSEVIDIVSEYRVYVNRRQIIGIKHYLGNPLIFPDAQIIADMVISATKLLNNVSFTLDVGVTKDGSTILIEPNDAWAIGNYGLDPDVYLDFCTDRWKQMTSNH